MRHGNIFRFLVFCLAVIAGGCAVGNKHNYHETIADINVQGSMSIAVTTSDQRQYVLSGEKRPHFVGLSRGGFGNPFGIGTESGKPLAEDMTQSIANSLAKKGFKVTPVMVDPPTANRQLFIDKLKATNADHYFILTLIEWKSDTYSSTSLLYDLKAEVLDREGKTLAVNTIQGKDDLGGAWGWNPPAYAKEAVPKAFKEKIEKLLNSPEMEASLR